MRWKERATAIPLGGETRTISVFLWLPMTINGETRFLEFARIKQEYGPFFLNADMWCREYGWADMGWAN